MKGKSALGLLLIFVVTVGLGLLAVFGIGEYARFGVGSIRQGLDLRGGVSILYEADLTDPTAAEMAAATALMRNRLDARGYLEATATQEGNRRIRVEIPGVEDTAAAVAAIGRTALLTFHSVVSFDAMGEPVLGPPLLDGTDVARANAPPPQQLRPGGGLEYIVELSFTPQGAVLFENATRANIGRQIAIVLDEEVISVAGVSEAITGGHGQISGGFNRARAHELAELITQGALPFGLDVIAENHIGARLGEGALESSILAGAIGLALVLLFMAFMYKSMGLCADWALIIYVILVLLTLSAFEVTLSLPAIAGIILSIGMAVDANVVIFERIRDEVAMGKTLRSALRVGYKRAMPAVIDSNVTTLIAGVVLFWLGTGPIMGFAQILIIGILVSMFTCLLVTRVLTVCLMNLGAVRIAHFKTNEEGAPEREPHPIIERRKFYFFFSATILTLGLAFMLFHNVRGNGWFNLDVEFSGGTQFSFDVGRSFNNNEIEALVRDASGVSSPQVQQILGGNHVMIRIPDTSLELRNNIVSALTAQFGVAEGDIDIYEVSAAVSQEMQRSALMAIGVASLAMLLYISVRFRDVRTGGAAVLAQLHDALVVLVVYAILRIPLNYAFIAVMLTTLGYSINATIIIFDRMRENKERLGKVTDAFLINQSVTQTLRRTLIATVSTFLAVLMLFILGVASIRDFTLPIIVGILFGAYSSVLLSGSTWYMMKRRKADGNS